MRARACIAPFFMAQAPIKPSLRHQDRAILRVQRTEISSASPVKSSTGEQQQGILIVPQQIAV
jgi:hypothetical protein